MSYISVVGWVHLIFCAAAIAAGGAVVLRPKGTRWHRTLGHAYAMSMVGVIVSAMSLYGRTGSFGPFHVAAIVSAVTLGGGLYSVLARRPRKSWMEAHAIWMSWSYIGLIAALAAESATHLVIPVASSFLAARSLLGAFWGAVGLATFLVVGVGARLVKTRLPRALAATPAGMRQERLRLRELDDPDGAETAAR